MNMKQKKASSIVITFYVISVLLLLVFIFMSWLVYDSIKLTMDQYSMGFGDIWGEMWQSIVNMFMTQSLPWLVYAIITYGIGCILNKVEGNAAAESESTMDDKKPETQNKEVDQVENTDDNADAAALPAASTKESIASDESEKVEKPESDKTDSSKPKAAKKSK